MSTTAAATTTESPSAGTGATGPGPRRFDDPLFERFPVSGVHRLSCGVVCHSPFFVPDGVGWMIFGTAEPETVSGLMARERYQPVVSAGRALACIWLTDFADSTVGPYRELTITFMVSTARQVLPWVNDFTPVAAQLRADTRVCEHLLLLDSQPAIDYGRELHGFDKRWGTLRFERAAAGGRAATRITVSEGGDLVVEAELAEGATRVERTRAMLGLMRALGTAATLREALRKTHRMRVVTPSVVMPTETDIYFQGFPLLRRFGAADRLRFGERSSAGRLLTRLGFRPLAIQHLRTTKGIMPLPR